MDTSLIEKIETALEIIKTLKSIEEIIINIGRQQGTLINSAGVDKTLRIPVNTELILLNELNNLNKPVRLLICFKKLESNKIALAVTEVITSTKWRSLANAHRYLSERESSIGHIPNAEKIFCNSVPDKKYMNLHYVIIINPEKVKEIAQIIDEIQSVVKRQSSILSR